MLTIAVVSLKSQLEIALTRARDDGSLEGANSDAIIAALAEDIGQAIHRYTMSATVNTAVNTAVAGGGSMGPIVGTGVGKGTGTLS